LRDEPLADRAVHPPKSPAPLAIAASENGDGGPPVAVRAQTDNPSAEPPSDPLSCGIHNPMPGGLAAGYAADTGLDLVGPPSPVYALAAGAVDYAERGHSLWSGPRDTDLAVRIALDEPIALADGRKVTHVWYAHLSELAFEQPSGAAKRRHVRAGERLGVSGRARGVNHLHLGLLLDGDTSQTWGTFLLEDEVRQVLCGLRSKHRLPKITRADDRRRSEAGGGRRDRTGG